MMYIGMRMRFMSFLFKLDSLERYNNVTSMAHSHSNTASCVMYFGKFFCVHRWRFHWFM